MIKTSSVYLTLEKEAVPELNETDIEILELLKKEMCGGSGESGMQPVDIAERLGKSQSHISERISHLEELDLVVKERQNHINVLVQLQSPDIFQSNN